VTVIVAPVVTPLTLAQATSRSLAATVNVAVVCAVEFDVLAVPTPCVHVTP
jgi:hypothetical protein